MYIWQGRPPGWLKSLRSSQLPGLGDLPNLKVEPPGPAPVKAGGNALLDKPPDFMQHRNEVLGCLAAQLSDNCFLGPVLGVSPVPRRWPSLISSVTSSSASMTSSMVVPRQFSVKVYMGVLRCAGAAAPLAADGVTAADGTAGACQGRREPLVSTLAGPGASARTP